MSVLIVSPLRVLFMCMAIGLVVFGTHLPASCQETASPVVTPEASSTVPSLADVVYQSFNLEVGILAHGYFPLDGAA